MSKIQSTAPRLMRLPEASAYTGLTERQIRRAVHDGRVSGVKPSGQTGPLFLDRADLDAWIDQAKTTAVSA